MSAPLPAAWLDAAHHLARVARRETLPRFDTALDVVDKGGGPFDPVTEADRQAEVAMRRWLADHLPEHAVQGEEEGITGGGAWRWILDPVDGTRAFITGFPTWTTLIALTHEGVPVLGLIDAPAAGRTWVGHLRPLDDGRPAGATVRRGDRATPSWTRRGRPLDQCVLSTTSPDLFPAGPRQRAWAALRDATRLRRYGGDGFAYGLLASGQIDLVLECGLAQHDLAAPVAVVQAAGGRATGWDGGPALDADHVLAAGDPDVHRRALTLLRQIGAAEAETPAADRA